MSENDLPRYTLPDARALFATTGVTLRCPVCRDKRDVAPSDLHDAMTVRLTGARSVADLLVDAQSVDVETATVSRAAYLIRGLLDEALDIYAQLSVAAYRSGAAGVR
ncbi:hypothetical protein EC912_10333 [Luteibacter rhizovicinus]|uniref:Uncharacterized protein n=1 Tax=Luteibacter rhizovicinus TaxID=242606 RepID=A0A4R3YQ65_9GAMM|nr:hypothetical protein [Luteibacter rhizovicinus]TCV94550.1 hypothetical protein EC912_10333 [Luteibacter rhizovicinus]